jgi:hypothetical protein
MCWMHKADLGCVPDVQVPSEPQVKRAERHLNNVDALCSLDSAGVCPVPLSEDNDYCCVKVVCS